MTDTTTIEIRNDQQEELRDMKQHDRESYKAVIDRLLEGDTDTEPMEVVPVDEVVGREVPQSSVEQDTDALRHQLERNYEAIKEATNAAEGAKRTVENLR